jgi:hypothetical protein
LRIVFLSCEAGIESINTALENDAERDIFVWIRVVVCNDFGNERFIDGECCIGTNAKLMPQRGVEQWLSMFLAILEGDTPESSEFGPDVPYGYAPAGYQSPRKHSFPQGGKRRKKKKRKK